MPPEPLGLVDRRGRLVEALHDRDPVTADKALDVREATSQQTNFRQAQAEMQQRLLAEFAAAQESQQQAPAAEQRQPQPTQQATPQQQQQPSPAQAQLAQASQAYAVAAQATDAERHAAAQIEAWTSTFRRQFPEAENPNAMEELRTRDPGRFQAMQAAASKAAQNIDGWMRRGASATAVRQANERVIALQHHAFTRAEWHKFKDAEDAKFSQFAPELRNPAQAHAMRDGVRKMLNEVGFGDKELAEAWDGRAGFSVRDHRAQRLLRDAFLWRQAQAKAKQITKAPVPPVQRPGTFRPPGAGNEDQIRSLERELGTATGAKAVRLATRLLQLKRAG
jgi:hypothetical protein